MKVLTIKNITAIAELHGFKKSDNFDEIIKDAGKLFFTKDYNEKRQLCLSYIIHLSTIDLFTSVKDEIPDPHMAINQFHIKTADELGFLLSRSSRSSDVRELIKEKAPIVEVKYSSGEMCYFYECPECKEEFTQYGFDEDNLGYCPNCMSIIRIKERRE